MASFKITGQPFLYKIWQRRLEKAQNKVRRYEDVTIDITGVILPTPSTMIIKFVNLNKKTKYELVLQGNYAELYKRKVEEGNTVTPEDVNAEMIIRQSIARAYSTNEMNNQ